MTNEQQDSLKPLDQITKPDSRSIWTGYDLEKLHAYLASMELHPGVPIDIRQLFETAKNAALYTWFVYRFHQVSEMVAFEALEFALRTKAMGLGLEKPPRPLGKRWGLSALLAYAQENQWLDNEAFPSLAGMAYRRASDEIVVRLMREQTDPSVDFPIPEPTEAQLAAAATAINVPLLLKETVPRIRNNLAHGSSTLHPQSLHTLNLVLETINQLFERPGSATAAAEA